MRPSQASGFLAASLALAAVLMAGSLPAAAAPRAWTVMPEQSSVSFLYTESGVDREGQFESFEGSGQLDDAAPESATLEVKVTSRSISLGSTLVDAFATSAEWFDSANHPLIVYRLTGLEHLFGDRFLSSGTLSIRGVEHDVVAPVMLDIGAETAHATGEVRLDRRDYGLGVGPSAAFVEIGRDVAVRFDLTARPVY